MRPSAGLGRRLRNLPRRRWAYVILTAQVAVIVVLLCRAFTLLQPAELAAYDRLVANWADRDPDKRILLVSVTEADISRYGWPLRDQQLADLLERLTAWGARVIGVDIYRDLSLPPGDQALVEVLKQHPEILWVYKLPDENGQGVAPPSTLSNSSRAVLADVVTDAGGVVRRGLLAANDSSAHRTVRTLGAAVAERYTAQELRTVGSDAALGSGRIVLVDRSFGPYASVDAAGYQTLLDFRHRRDQLQEVSLSDLMRGDAAAALVRGRAVLVGAEATSVNDSFATPFSTGRHSGKPLAGVMLHAYLADQLIRANANEASGRTVLPRSAEDAIIWACSMAASAAGLALPSAGLAFATAIAAGFGLIVSITYLTFGMAGLVLPGVPAAFAWLGSAAAAVWVLHGVGLRERVRLKRTFEHYLDPRIIDDMLASGSLPSLGGERREVSVVFTDVASFTALAEELPAEEVAMLMGDYFDGVCAAVLACGGLVSVFEGDGLQLLFGAPRHQDDHPDRAVEAALRIDAFARRFSAKQHDRGVAFGSTRIGVHTGIALVGNVGTRARLNYGAVGDVVNTASRLENLNKRIGTRIAVSGETARRCSRHRFRPVGEFVLKGRSDVLAVATPVILGELDQRQVLQYEAAYAALSDGDPQASAMFLTLDRNDPCANFHRARLVAGEAGVQIVMAEK